MSQWLEPVWAVVCAAFGQVVMVAIWFARPSQQEQKRNPARLRSDRYVRGSRAMGLAVSISAAGFLGRMWEAYGSVFHIGNLWASAFGEPLAADPFGPFLPFGAFAIALAAIIALMPWHGVQRKYRCGWWPAASVTGALAYGMVLYGLERWIGVLGPSL